MSDQLNEVTSSLDRRNEERARHDISTRLTSDATQDVLYGDIVEGAIAIMQADAGSIQVFDAGSDSLTLLASRGFHAKSAAFWARVDAASGSACGETLRVRQRVVVADVDACDFIKGTDDHAEYHRSGLCAVQSTPLVSRAGKPLGVISTLWRQPQTTSEHDFRVFDVLARQAADLLDHFLSERALRATEERQAFMLQLGDALRLVSDPFAVQRIAMRMLARHLCVDAGFYSEAYSAAEFASVTDRLRTGGSVVVCDARNGERNPFVEPDASQIGDPIAWVGIPLVKDDRLVAVFGVHHSQPREWTPEEIAVIEDTAERTWAAVERARVETSLRESEQRLRSTVAERDALLRELHHRVKNNLQVISSLLELQVRQAVNPQTLSSLLEARNRVTAIAAIHELLYQADSLSEVDLARYARELVPHVVSLYEQQARVKVAVVGDAVAIDLARAVPFGLLLNELVSNACKHAFSISGGELTVALHQDDRHIHLRVTDSGAGLPRGFDAGTCETLGVHLVRALVKQLGGTATFTSAGGTSVDVRVPTETAMA